MGEGLFRRFLTAVQGTRPASGNAAPGEKPSDAALGEPRAAAAPPHSPPAPPQPMVVDPQREKNALARTLREELLRRCHALLDGLPDAMRRTDAPAVVDALVGQRETVIHQPPIAAQRALAVSRDPYSSVNDLVLLFEHDPGLAQALLKQANSSFYSRGEGACDALGPAIQRVGMKGVENVLLASMVEGMLCRPGGAYDSLVQKVWSHMVRCGPIGRQLSPCFGVDPERGFAMALLHDAGKLVLFDRIAALRKAWRREVNLPQHFLLWTLKRLHEPVGGLAGLEWGLGVPAAQAISIHHRDPVPPHPDPLSEVVFLAERMDLAGIRQQPLDLEALWAAGGLGGEPGAARQALSEWPQAA